MVEVTPAVAAAPPRDGIPGTAASASLTEGGAEGRGLATTVQVVGFDPAAGDARKEYSEDPELPLYEYECPKDGVFERIQKFSDPPLAACPSCGGPIEKLASAPAIQFKGTGWYITDYARKSSGGEGGKDKGAAGLGQGQGRRRGLGQGQGRALEGEGRRRGERVDIRSRQEPREEVSGTTKSRHWADPSGRPLLAAAGMTFNAESYPGPVTFEM